MKTFVDKVSRRPDPDDPRAGGGETILSRGQLLEIEEDPSKLETVARLMGAVNLDNLFRHMQGHDVAVTAKIEFQKLLNKMGKLEPDDKDAQGAGGPQVVINITRARDHEIGDHAPHSVTIEGVSANAEQ